jgi:hypothetical protein
LLVVAAVAMPACTDGLGTTSEPLTSQVKLERVTAIRDIAAQMGLYNAALLGGIAISETGLAHCWSEATWACQGPASSSCADGPIIAGASDGPCPSMLGGLGMFQFDAGTYTDTLNAYGPDVLTVEGNTALAVNFVVTKVIQDVPGVTDWRGAVAWMNQVPLTAGDPISDQWASLLACRYNGCCSQSATCKARGAAYRDNAITVFGDYGADFWRTADRCAAIPADGVIEQRSDCYLAGGDPRYWHHEATGSGGALEWTNGTPAAAPANFGEWILRPGAAHRLHLEVSLDGGTFGQAKAARYTIVHAGKTDVVTLDQSAATGYVALGDFAFAADGDQYVLLGDDTGDAAATKTHVLFDALRATSLDGPLPPPPDPGPMTPGGCGCQGSAGGASGALLIALALGLGVRRRRAAR